MVVTVESVDIKVACVFVEAEGEIGFAVQNEAR